MKYKKDNKLPNTKNVRRKTNPAGVTTIIQPKSSSSGSSNNPSSGGGGGGGGGSMGEGGEGMNSYIPSPGAPQLPPGSLKQEPGKYGLTSL